MRGLLMVALALFVLFLLISGRLSRVPAAWGFLVDGTVDATGTGAGPEPTSTLGKIGAIIGGGLTGGMSPAQAAQAGASVVGAGAWPARGGRTSSQTVTDAPPMTRPPAPTFPARAPATAPAAGPTAAQQAAATVQGARAKLCAAFPIPGYC